MQPDVPVLFPDASLRRLVLPFQPRPIRLLVLQDPLELLDRNPQPGDPQPDVYWGELWPASVALAETLLTGKVWLPGGPQPILELGCGAGLTSVAAALAGQGEARVRATDREPRALALTRANAEANGVAHLIETRVLDWRERSPERYRLILATDCLYSPDAGHELATFLRRALAEDDRDEARAVLVDPERWSARDFRFVAEEAGFHVNCFRWPVPFTAGSAGNEWLPRSGPPTDAGDPREGAVWTTFYELKRR
jgi:predicted nicotinamide N-methyase